MIRKVVQGNPYDVQIETLGKNVVATIEEIAPYADPSTRTFLVKAALPDTPGIYPGMFGRLLIPVQEEKTLLIPEAAITRVGQLETVNAKSPEESEFRSLYIKTGKPFGDKIEVLSGLLGTEILGY